MALSFTGFVDGDIVSASTIKSQLDDVEDFVNEGISSSDLTTSTKWLTRELIYKPEFYGAPAPRVEAITGDTHYRLAPFGIPDQAHFHCDANLQAQAVHGLAVTFKVPRNNTNVSVACNFWAYESGGNISQTFCTIPPTAGTDEVSDMEQDDRHAAKFSLRFDAGQSSDDDEIGTARYLYLGSDVSEAWIDNYSGGTNPFRVTTTANFIARKNFSIICHKTLDQGVHSVAVYCKPVVPPNVSSSIFKGRVAVDVRSMIVDVHSNYQGT